MNTPTAAINNELWGLSAWDDMYTLDYLVRKLPPYITIDGAYFYFMLRNHENRWTAQYGPGHFKRNNSTPEDAVARLLIELLKAGKL